MQTESAETKRIAETIELSTDQLLGFRHVASDVADENFVEDAAAAFNKIGTPGEGPIIGTGSAAI